MKTVVYQGYTIKSFPHRLLKSDQWTINLQICWTDRGLTTMKNFAVDTPYATEEDADVHGIANRQRIIDGTVSGAPVSE